MGSSSKHLGVTESEDCLFVNVIAPTNATQTSKLPVYLFIQGGGFGINSNPNINGTGLVIAAEYDMVVVSFNYRVGPYGFLTDGNEVTSNIGLRDQLKAMQWVQKNIHLFGGNPDHVVLNGVSAGAASVAIHLTANHGRDLNLFHGVIAESPSFATLLTVNQSYYQYKQFATRLGCAGKNSLQCLRTKNTTEIQQQNFNIPFPGGANPPDYMWEPSLDNEFVDDYTVRAFQQGKFIKVPAIFGDDSNGGTKFTPTNTTTVAQSNQFMLDQYPYLTLENLGDLNELYPNPNHTCPQSGCYWRQVSNVYGEARYMCPALGVTSLLSKYGVSKSYAYRWNVADPAQVASGAGVPHTIEVNALLGPDYAPADDVPDSYKVGGINEAASPVIQAYWTSFVRTLNPNTHRHPGSARWKSWTEESEARLLFDVGGKTSMEKLDAGLQQRCQFWADNGLSLHL